METNETERRARGVRQAAGGDPLQGGRLRQSEGAAEGAAKKPASELDELKAQMAEMQKKLDKLGK